MITLISQEVGENLMKKVKVGTLNLLRIVKHSVLQREREYIKYRKYKMGHYAVTRSLINGLDRLGYVYNHNPGSFSDFYDTTIVLGDVNALRQAIRAKEAGHINKLIAGPNVMVYADDHEKILSNKMINLYIVPSEWVLKTSLQDNPSLEKKIKVWYAGVDIDFWKPNLITKKKKALVYIKIEDNALINDVKVILSKYGWDIEEIVYSNYTSIEYKEKMNECQIGVFLTRSETQGLAIAEAWAMDVFTMVWNISGDITFKGRVQRNVNSAPYLSAHNGVYWSTVNELENCLKDVKSLLLQSEPRNWVLNHMSDVITARNLLAMIEDL